MSFAVVWGTRIRESDLGCVAFHCPYCVELVAADCALVEEASHVYYIRGRYKELGRYLRCRLCGNAVDVNEPLLNPQPLPTDQLWPTTEFVKQTNPAVGMADLESIPLLEALPDGVDRRE